MPEDLIPQSGAVNAEKRSLKAQTIEVSQTKRNTTARNTKINDVVPEMLLSGATDFKYGKQMKTTGQLYHLKSNGIIHRTLIIVEEAFTLDGHFGQEETDTSEYSWHSDLYGMPEC